MNRSCLSPDGTKFYEHIVFNFVHIKLKSNLVFMLYVQTLLSINCFRITKNILIESIPLHESLRIVIFYS